MGLAAASTGSRPPPEPSARVGGRLARLLATWFGCGLVPRAPGTAGTLGAVPLYLCLRPYGLAPVAIAAAVVTAVGIWAAGREAERLGLEDPQVVCIDEVAGVLVTWLGAPTGWLGTLLGVLLFRVLDVIKPWPANLAEERLPPALGIMFDDLIAGAFGAVILLSAQRLGWI